MDSKKGKHSKQSNQKKSSSSKGQVNPDLVAEYVREEIPKSKSQKRKAPSQPHNSGKQSVDSQKSKGKKDRASQVYPMCSWSNIELIVWTVLVAAVGTIYHKLMMRIYSVEAWNDFDHFAKVLINHFGFCKVQRSMLRAIVFNIVRTMFDELVFYVVFGDVVPEAILAKRILLTITFTVVVEFTVSKKAANRHATEWSAFMIFYVTTFALLFTSALTRVEQEFKGDVGRLFLCAFGLIIAYLQGDMLEDLLLGGLNRVGGIWHNWPFYMPAFTVIASGFVLNHWQVLGDVTTGAWRHPNVSAAEFMYKTGKSPLYWPMITFGSQEDPKYFFTIMAYNVIYAFTTLYWQLQWKSSLKTKKF